MIRRPRHIHLVGIGGIGLSAIARILIERGESVSGSDLSETPVTQELGLLGARIFIGHRAENVDNADLVLATSAAQPDNPELTEARRRGIRVVKRIDFFPELTAGKMTIAVAGTHGKTTTTGMVASILLRAGKDPSVIVGGMILELGGNARAGKGDHFVIEADEYDRAFLGLHPSIAVVTSIEMDHPDCYRDLNDMANGFRQFLSEVPPGGFVVGCGDDARVAAELGRLQGPEAERYGLAETNEWWATDIVSNGPGMEFKVWHRGKTMGSFSLRIPGRHNVLNALAAIAVANRVGIDWATVHKTLSEFQGASRRFEVKGEFRGITVIDDYAHHPSEIRATLAAARARYHGRAIWAVFQPHTFSRTRALLREFANAFADADHVIVTEVYGAREYDSQGVSGRRVVEPMRHPDARFIGALDRCAEFLLQRLNPGDVLITLGAGDVNRVGVQVVRALQGAG